MGYGCKCLVELGLQKLVWAKYNLFLTKFSVKTWHWWIYFRKTSLPAQKI